MSAFLTALGGGSAAILIAAYFGRRFIDIQVARAIKKHETALTQKTEVLKTEFSIYAHQQNVGLTRIDAQRSEAILSIWAALAEWQETYLDITAPNQTLHKDATQAIQKYKKVALQLMTLSDRLSIEVRNRAIFFDQAVYQTIARYGMALSEVTNTFFADSYEGVDLSNMIDHPAFLDRVLASRRKLREAARGDIDELRRTLVLEFRLLMNAEKPASKNGLHR